MAIDPSSGAFYEPYRGTGYVYPPFQSMPQELARAVVPGVDPAEYTGLGIFPWETPAGVGFRAPWTPEAPAIAPVANGFSPAAAVVPAAAAVVGGGAVGGIAALLGGAYGLAELIGVQFPWESGPGEGMISPLTPQVRDESGRWVTPQTRPDLFTPATAGRMAGLLNGGGQAAGKVIGGDVVVSAWDTSRPGMPGTGWIFYRLANGKIGTMTKEGMWKTWRPKKHIILPRGSTTLSQAVKAQRYLDRMWRTVAKKTKAIKLA